MKKITTWSPDTCGCVLHYEWDTDDPAETRVHTPVKSVTTHDGLVIPATVCRHHLQFAKDNAELHLMQKSDGRMGLIIPVGDHVSHYKAVLAENQKKNLAHYLLAVKIFGPPPEPEPAGAEGAVRLSISPDTLLWPTDHQAKLDAWQRRAATITFSYDINRRLTMTVHAPSYTADDLKKHLADVGHPDVEVVVNG